MLLLYQAGFLDPVGSALLTAVPTTEECPPFVNELGATFVSNAFPRSKKIRIELRETMKEDKRNVSLIC